ncbi:hypothetical protein ACROYT_G029574 [Oculina patagonica]
MARLQNLNRKHSKETEKSPNQTRNFKPYLLVGITAIVCYLNSLFGEFVYDDYEVIETNSDIRTSSPISNLFANDFWGLPMKRNDSHKSYRPITVLTFRWNFLLGGLNPIGYHLVNVLLHSVVSMLFLHVCTRIFNGCACSKTNSLSLLCGLFFALHPIHTEAIANVVGRADILCGFFYLLALLSYFNCFSEGTTNDSSKRPTKYSRLWLASCIFWCVLSLFSKENGITVLGVCVVYDFVFVCKFNAGYLLKASFSPTVLFSFRQWPKWTVRLVERISILAFVAVILLYLRIVIISGGFVLSFTESDNPTLFHPDVWTRFRTYSYLCALNARLLLCPNILCYDWSMDSISRIETWWDMRNAETLAFSVAVAWLFCYGVKSSNTSFSSPEKTEKPKLCSPNSLTLDANDNNIHARKEMKIKEPQNSGEKTLTNECDSLHRRRVVLLSLAMLIIPFLPASNLFLPVGFVVAERILYIPSMGLCLLVPFGISILFQDSTKGESLTKEDSEEKVKKETSSISWSFGLNAAGIVIVYSLLLVFAFKTVHRNAEWQNKETLARSGLKVNPTNAKIHVMLGNVIAKKGLLSCEGHYREALRLRPHYVAAWENLGLVLLNTERAQEAEKCYLKALSIKPNSADGNINLAHLLRVTGRFSEADVQYQKALSLRPNNPQLNYFHGVVLEKLGKQKKAEERYIKTTKLTPSDPIPFLTLGKMLVMPVLQKKVKSGSERGIKKGEEYLRKGVALKPSDLDGRLLLVQIHLLKGELDSAESEVRYILAHDVYSKDAEYVLGRILELKGSLKEARHYYHEVLKKDYMHTGAREGLQRLNKKSIK